MGDSVFLMKLESNKSEQSQPPKPSMNHWHINYAGLVYKILDPFSCQIDFH